MELKPQRTGSCGKGRHRGRFGSCLWLWQFNSPPFRQGLGLSQVKGWGEGNFTKSNWGGDKLEDMAAVARVRKTKPENRDPQMVVVQRVSRAADEAELVAIREDNVGLDGDAMAMELQQVVEEDRAKQRKMTR